jgi:hypothetical protein
VVLSLLLTLLALLALPAVVACGPPAETPALECDNPHLTDLGRVTLDAPARFTTSGGRARFSIADPDTGAVFDSITSDDRTISVGDSLTVPERVSPQKATVTNALAEVDVDPEHPGTLDLEPGSYWLASYSASVTMASCSGTTITSVVPGVGTVYTTTPSPTPAG